MRSPALARAHRGATIGVAAIAIAAIGFGIYWFAPQNLFLDRRVDEAPPGLQGDGPGAYGEDPLQLGHRGDRGPKREDASPSAMPESSGPVVVSRGTFASLEHATSGSALLVRLEDGSHVVRLEDLDTSNGPDLRVLISDRPPSDDWHGWADGAHADLGGLKGNVGSSNYAVPTDVDPADYRTVVVWCRRFTVGFGVAPISPSSSVPD
jgi:electron transfer DM13